MSESFAGLKARREELGLSMAELAAAVGVSRTTIFYYENGMVKKPFRETVRKIEAALGVFAEDMTEAETGIAARARARTRRAPLLSSQVLSRVLESVHTGRYFMR